MINLLSDPLVYTECVQLSCRLLEIDNACVDKQSTVLSTNQMRSNDSVTRMTFALKEGA